MVAISAGLASNMTFWASASVLSPASSARLNASIAWPTLAKVASDGSVYCSWLQGEDRNEQISADGLAALPCERRPAAFLTMR
ncbi:hypothetical protein ABH920_003029 [Catenulispora sp. EB89]|uniref:hypothetical protein n=1 Tax=Catenulispora sp. EB89 TaxID=3156257 RepID=UPI003514748D